MLICFIWPFLTEFAWTINSDTTSKSKYKQNMNDKTLQRNIFISTVEQI